MGQNKLRAFLHFVWATHDRLPLITAEIERDLYRYISEVCRDDKCEVFAVGGMPDHIHLLVGLSNTITLADLMKHIKGGSSRFVSQKLKPGEWFAWQSSYAVFAVSPRDKKMALGYIRNQKQHHAENTLWPEAETTEEEAEANDQA